MKRFRLYFDREINMTHIEKHHVSEQEIAEFFNDIVIWTRKRNDDSYESIGKLINGRYLAVIYRKGVEQNMKTIKKRHFIIEYVIPDSEEEEKEIKKIIHEVQEEEIKLDLSDYVMEKPADSTDD